MARKYHINLGIKFDFQIDFYGGYDFLISEIKKEKKKDKATKRDIKNKIKELIKASVTKALNIV